LANGALTPENLEKTKEFNENRTKEEKSEIKESPEPESKEL